MTSFEKKIPFAPQLDFRRLIQERLPVMMFDAQTRHSYRSREYLRPSPSRVVTYDDIRETVTPAFRPCDLSSIAACDQSAFRGPCSPWLYAPAACLRAAIFGQRKYAWTNSMKNTVCYSFHSTARLLVTRACAARIAFSRVSSVHRA